MKEVDEHRVVLFPQQIIRIEREKIRRFFFQWHFDGSILYDAPYIDCTPLYISSCRQ